MSNMPAAACQQRIGDFLEFKLNKVCIWLRVQKVRKMTFVLTKLKFGRRSPIETVMHHCPALQFSYVERHRLLQVAPSCGRENIYDLSEAIMPFLKPKTELGSFFCFIGAQIESVCSSYGREVCVA